MKEVSLLKLLKKKSKLYEDLEQLDFEIESRRYGEYSGYKVTKKLECLKKIEELNKKLKPLLIKELESLK